MDNTDVFSDGPGELDLYNRGDLQKAMYAHMAGDPHALGNTVVHCVDQGIPIPKWAARDTIRIMQKAMGASKKDTGTHAAKTACAAALHVAEDHLGFDFKYRYDTSTGSVCKLAERLLVDNFEVLKAQGIVVTDIKSNWVALQDWWYKNDAKNRRLYMEPDSDLYRLFSQSVTL